MSGVEIDVGCEPVPAAAAWALGDPPNRADPVAELAALLLDLLGDVDRETLRELARRAAAPGDRGLYPLAALGGVAEICERLGVKKSRASMWATRRDYTGFPEPVVPLRCGDVYDLREVDRWWATWSATRRPDGGEP